MVQTKNEKLKKWFYGGLAVLFWLLVWQFTSMAIDSELLLASPVTTIKTLFSLLGETAFWSSIFASFFRIVSGFLIAVITGVLLAVFAYKFTPIKILLSPIITVIKTVPVASFIILALVWVSGKNLSTLISFLMVLPVVYTNTFDGISKTDKKLLQMAQVFKIGAFKKMLAIYLPTVFGFFMSGCKIGLGLCWKSGIAAEVIGLPIGTLGERLYQAKIFLSTGEVFAITIVIVVVSVVFEKIFMLALRILRKTIEGGVF